MFGERKGAMGLSSGSLHTLGVYLGAMPSDYTPMKRTPFYQRHNIPKVVFSKKEGMCKNISLVNFLIGLSRLQIALSCMYVKISHLLNKCL